MLTIRVYKLEGSTDPEASDDSDEDDDDVEGGGAADALHTPQQSVSNPHQPVLDPQSSPIALDLDTTGESVSLDAGSGEEEEEEEREDDDTEPHNNTEKPGIADDDVDNRSSSSDDDSEDNIPPPPPSPPMLNADRRQLKSTEDRPMLRSPQAEESTTTGESVSPLTHKDGPDTTKKKKKTLEKKKGFVKTILKPPTKSSSPPRTAIKPPPKTVTLQTDEFRDVTIMQYTQGRLVHGMKLDTNGVLLLRGYDMKYRPYTAYEHKVLSDGGFLLYYSEHVDPVTRTFKNDGDNPLPLFPILLENRNATVEYNGKQLRTRDIRKRHMTINAARELVDVYGPLNKARATFKDVLQHIANIKGALLEHTVNFTKAAAEMYRDITSQKDDDRAQFANIVDDLEKAMATAKHVKKAKKELPKQALDAYNRVWEHYAELQVVRLNDTFNARHPYSYKIPRFTVYDLDDYDQDEYLSNIPPLTIVGSGTEDIDIQITEYSMSFMARLTHPFFTCMTVDTAFEETMDPYSPPLVCHTYNPDTRQGDWPLRVELHKKRANTDINETSRKQSYWNDICGKLKLFDAVDEYEQCMVHKRTGSDTYIENVNMLLADLNKTDDILQRDLIAYIRNNLLSKKAAWDAVTLIQHYEHLADNMKYDALGPIGNAMHGKLLMTLAVLERGWHPLHGAGVGTQLKFASGHEYTLSRIGMAHDYDPKLTQFIPGKGHEGSVRRDENDILHTSRGRDDDKFVVVELQTITSTHTRHEFRESMRMIFTPRTLGDDPSILWVKTEEADGPLEVDSDRLHNSRLVSIDGITYADAKSANDALNKEGGDDKDVIVVVAREGNEEAFQRYYTPKSRTGVMLHRGNTHMLIHVHNEAVLTPTNSASPPQLEKDAHIQTKDFGVRDASYDEPACGAYVGSNIPIGMTSDGIVEYVVTIGPDFVGTISAGFFVDENDNNRDTKAVRESALDYATWDIVDLEETEELRRELQHKNQYDAYKTAQKMKDGETKLSSEFASSGDGNLYASNDPDKNGYTSWGDMDCHIRVTMNFKTGHLTLTKAGSSTHSLVHMFSPTQYRGCRHIYPMVTAKLNTVLHIKCTSSDVADAKFVRGLPTYTLTPNGAYSLLNEDPEDTFTVTLPKRPPFYTRGTTSFQFTQRNLSPSGTLAVLENTNCTKGLIGDDYVITADAIKGRAAKLRDTEIYYMNRDCTFRVWELIEVLCESEFLMNEVFDDAFNQPHGYFEDHLKVWYEKVVPPTLHIVPAGTMVEERTVPSFVYQTSKETPIVEVTSTEIPLDDGRLMNIPAYVKDPVHVFYSTAITFKDHTTKTAITYNDYTNYTTSQIRTCPEYAYHKLAKTKYKYYPGRETELDGKRVVVLYDSPHAIVNKHAKYATNTALLEYSTFDSTRIQVDQMSEADCIAEYYDLYYKHQKSKLELSGLPKEELKSKVTEMNAINEWARMVTVDIVFDAGDEDVITIIQQYNRLLNTAKIVLHSTARAMDTQKAAPYLMKRIATLAQQATIKLKDVGAITKVLNGSSKWILKCALYTFALTIEPPDVTHNHVYSNLNSAIKQLLTLLADGGYITQTLIRRPNATVSTAMGTYAHIATKGINTDAKQSEHGGFTLFGLQGPAIKEQCETAQQHFSSRFIRNGCVLYQNNLDLSSLAHHHSTTSGEYDGEMEEILDNDDDASAEEDKDYSSSSESDESTSDDDDDDDNDDDEEDSVTNTYATVGNEYFTDKPYIQATAFSDDLPDEIKKL